MPREITAQVAYSGPAVAEGAMDYRELAPALLAIGDLLQSANRALNGERTAFAVYVESDFKSGSFEIKFGLETLQQAAFLTGVFVAGDPIKTAKQIAEYVGLLTGTKPSLFAFLKWLRGRKPSAVTTPTNQGDDNVIVKVDGDGNSITINKNVYVLANDPEVRKHVAETVKPLEDPGIETFEIREGSTPVETVTKGELPAFRAPLELAVQAEQQDLSTVRPQLVEVIKPSFDPALKYTLSDGSGGKMNALMKDEGFAERVQNGERSFAKGDVLRVLVKSTPKITADGLRTDHEVLKVLEEFNAPRQVGLLPEPKPSNGEE